MIAALPSLSDAIQGMNDLIRDHGGELPPVTYAAISAFYPSPVDRVVKTAEALYAAGAATPPAGKALCAQLAGFATANAWHALGQTDRGLRMAVAMRRDLGETVDQPASADPEPLEDFVPPPAA